MLNSVISRHAKRGSRAGITAPRRRSPHLRAAGATPAGSVRHPEQRAGQRESVRALAVARRRRRTSLARGLPWASFSEPGCRVRALWKALASFLRFPSVRESIGREEKIKNDMGLVFVRPRGGERRPREVSVKFVVDFTTTVLGSTT